MSEPYRILVLCTGNSARSILAEALINHLGGGRFEALSAGSHPAGRVNPLAIEALKAHRVPTKGLRSKSWNEFSRPESLPMDLVITVCDAAAGESCPYWPGAPLKVHWGLPDPAAVTGSEAERRAAFAQAYRRLEVRVQKLVGLQPWTFSRSRLQRQLEEIHAAAD